MKWPQWIKRHFPSPRKIVSPTEVEAYIQQGMYEKAFLIIWEGNLGPRNIRADLMRKLVINLIIDLKKIKDPTGRDTNDIL